MRPDWKGGVAVALAMEARAGTLESRKKNGKYLQKKTDGRAKKSAVHKEKNILIF